ncbi:unnamed protein product [Soboliphyme baturini]|uniref:Uncharacterized protein n=1 Tax=Soboliphyme baturini TaxID=241478 RepID=A0A3P8E1U2_9BILA|nr:unnamed protein product [Soboliphyme baturini]
MITALLTSAFIYRVGTPSNCKTQNLVQWSLQCLAIFLLYSGSQLRSVSLAIIVSCIVVKLVPVWLIEFVAYAKHRLFPEKYRFLTKDEYEQQGVVETERALNDLRIFCRSPGCDSWKLVSRLRTPANSADCFAFCLVLNAKIIARFADFVAGASDVSSDEAMRHDHTVSEVNEFCASGSYEDDVLTDENDTDSSEDEFISGAAPLTNRSYNLNSTRRTSFNYR